jgi:hypothetical protein
MRQLLLRSSQIIGDLLFLLKKTSVWILITKKLNLVVFLALLFSSCLKDRFDFDRLKNDGWTPELGLPLAHTSLDIRHLMKSESDSGYLTLDSSLFCTLIYSGTAASIAASDLFTLPDVSFNIQCPVTAEWANLINTLGQATVSFEQPIELSMPNGISLDSVHYKSGQLWLTIRVRIPADVLLTLSIPSSSLNGHPYASTHQFHYRGTLPMEETVAVNLAGYRFDLSDNGTSRNRIRIKMDWRMVHTGTPVTTDHRINLLASLNANKFYGIYGYLGRQSITSDYDTIELSLFRHVNALSSFNILNPQIRIGFSNSVGIPLHAQVVTMKGTDGDFTDLIVAQGFPNPLPVPSPAFNQIGQTLTGEFIMHSGNSNIRQVIAAKPRFLLTRLQSTTNPDGHSGRQNFLTDSSKIDVHVEVKLPMHGTAENFYLTDTVAFHYNHLQQLQRMTIRTFFSNGFPFDARWQVYFTDSQYRLLDSLVTIGSLFMPSAIVDPVSGKVTQPSVILHDNSLDRSRILNLTHTKNLIIRAHAVTTGNASVNVKIYGDYRMDVHLGVIATIRL